MSFVIANLKKDLKLFLKSFTININLGGVAQSVEQRDHNPRVGGSIPSSATILS
jgi:hypothetical protein